MRSPGAVPVSARERVHPFDGVTFSANQSSTAGNGSFRTPARPCETHASGAGTTVNPVS
jgi:hypothetical protein